MNIHMAQLRASGVSLLLLDYFHDNDVISLSRTCKTSTSFLHKYKLKCYYHYSPESRKQTGIVFCHLLDVTLQDLENLDEHHRHSVASLMLGPRFSQPILPGVLPASLTSLMIGSSILGYNAFASYNHPFDVGVFPNSLTILNFGNDFNQPLEAGVLPCSLISLVMGRSFNQLLVPGVFPNSLTNLHMAEWFDKPLVHGVFPNSLTSLTMGCLFNQPVQPGVFPCSLLSLVMGFQFDQPRELGVLPDSLTNLTLSPLYTRPLIVNSTLRPCESPVKSWGWKEYERFCKCGE